MTERFRTPIAEKRTFSLFENKQNEQNTLKNGQNGKINSKAIAESSENPQKDDAKRKKRNAKAAEISIV